ncbi:MAG: alpha/beta fold hydrolase [Ignavibacteria bacterium]
MTIRFAVADGHRLEYELIEGDPASAPLVFLHEGLGSIAMWRDFPQRVAAATGRRALVYSRYGYGRSDRLLARRQPDYMHAEALAALPALLDSLALERPILIGHSDGASIALIHAGGAQRAVAGVVAMAPHVMVEELALAGIRATVAAYETTALNERLARYHDDADSAFRGWSDIWLSAAFRAWNIEEYLPRIAVPVLAIQGYGDEYGTMDQLDRIVAAAPDVETLRLADCGHAPHRDQPDAVIAAVAAFVRRAG